MKLGVFTVLFSGMDFDRMIEKVASHGLDCVELGTGAYPGNAHCKPAELLAQPSLLSAFRGSIERAGLFISALACQGNPLHPNKEVAAEHQAVFEQTVLLAEQLRVPVINLLSGCPGESLNSRYPNWPGFAWPPEYPDLWEWQWNEVAIPYWRDAAAVAAAHGVMKLAIEMHPGFLVYNPETALKLRDAVGETIGVNFDPSHLLWMGIDPTVAIRALGSCIFHFHAKDVAINRYNVAVNGSIDRKPYSQVGARSWNFRTPGWGHGTGIWRSMISSLRVAGYDYVLSIEHEDPLTSVEEGLRNSIRFLRGSLLTEAPPEIWWA